MTTVTEGFCTSLPTQPLHWDATRLRTAQRCWRKHWYETVLGLRLNSGGSVHTEFGSLYHGAVECFDLALLAGKSREEATFEGLRWLLHSTWTEDGQPWGGSLEDCWQCTDPAQRPHKRDPNKLVENKGRCQWAKAATPFMPVRPRAGGWECLACDRRAVKSRRYLPFDPKKNRVSLVRAFMLYADTKEGLEPYRFPDGTPAVELQCRIPLPLTSPDGSPYELVANLDSLVLWEGELAVRERKTTARRLDARYWAEFDLDPQIDTYDLVAWTLYAEPLPLRVLVEAMQVGEGFARLRRMPITIPEGRREEWFRELQSVIKDAECRAGDFARNRPLWHAWPRNTSACHAPFPCPFLRVCKAAPEHREAILAADYREERWNPLRGETDV